MMSPSWILKSWVSVMPLTPTMKSPGLTMSEAPPPLPPPSVPLAKAPTLLRSLCRCTAPAPMRMICTPFSLTSKAMPRMFSSLHRRTLNLYGCSLGGLTSRHAAGVTAERGPLSKESAFSSLLASTGSASNRSSSKLPFKPGCGFSRPPLLSKTSRLGWLIIWTTSSSTSTACPGSWPQAQQKRNMARPPARPATVGSLRATTSSGRLGPKRA
mmetsp:Transcript_14791/g.40579  ORF Transcript_14791/g.40579 Transcript_14791/m.40579 type:complete len:213 (+) Transcript_14791:278-916(+)